jgi:hypothetical protein
MSIGPEETELRDAPRIRRLVETELQHIASSRDGWDRLYRDALDGRFWELSYPKSEMHGGGPPLLRVVGASYAAQHFALKAP